MDTKLLLLGKGQTEKTSRSTERVPITQQMIDDYPVNYKGLYSLKYKKKKEPKGSTISDIEKKFADYGKVTEVDGDDWWIYVRFAVKDHAVAVIKAFGEELNLKIPSDFHQKKNGSVQRIVEVYIGNLPPIVKEYEVEEMLSKYAPFKLKVNHISNDPGKRFKSVFVKFSQDDREKAAELIKEKDGKVWKGKKLYVGYARNRTGRSGDAGRKEGDEEMATNAVTAKSSQDTPSGMIIKPLHRTSSHDSKGFAGTIPKMLPSRREPVADNECPSNKAWWKKN